MTNRRPGYGNQQRAERMAQEFAATTYRLDAKARLAVTAALRSSVRGLVSPTAIPSRVRRAEELSVMAVQRYELLCENYRREAEYKS